jgi:hypothetical protein
MGKEHQKKRKTFTAYPVLGDGVCQDRLQPRLVQIFATPFDFLRLGMYNAGVLYDLEVRERRSIDVTRK